MAETVEMDDQKIGGIAPIEEIIAEAKRGRMFILVDAETRENEGDLIIPATAATAEAVNFMAKHGRGLICLALESARAEELELDYMVRHNQARNQTAFTVSIEAREGISTGISAHDRAHTISVAINREKGPNDLVSPGHVFPLIARDGGVLVRAGHTEAAVDIARLAGQDPSGVICEIMNDDGSMARLPELIAFAKQHDLKIGTIADLIAYRRTHDQLIYKASEHQIDIPFAGTFTCHIFRSKLDDVEHVALTKGDMTSNEPILVRMHGCNLMRDMLSLGTDMSGADTIKKSLQTIEKNGRGALVMVRHGERGALASHLAEVENKDQQAKSETGKSEKLLEYGIGAQILANLGIKKIILLSNSTLPKIVGLDKFECEIIGQETIN